MKKYGISKITMFNLIWILVGILLLIVVWIVDKNNIDGAGPVMTKISIFYVQFPLAVNLVYLVYKRIKKHKDKNKE